MAKWKLVACLVFLSLLVLPGGAIAEEDEDDLVEEGLVGDVTIGAGGVGLDNESFKFGEYSGLEDSQGFFVGEADLNYNRKSYYFDFFADDIGLENRTLYFETGKYGDFSFYAEFDQQPHLLSNTSLTPLAGGGTTDQTLPAGFVRSNTTSGMTIAGVQNVDLEIDGRESESFGFKKSFGLTDFQLDFKREDKDGIQSLGGTFGTNGGNARSVVFAEPLKQTVNEIKATLSHTGEGGQVQLQYFLSLFDNHRESVTFQNPFTGAITALTQPVGLISRAPDNQYQKISLSGGVNVSRSTRVSGIVEYGIMEQDEDLLPLGFGSAPSLLPRQTADTEIETLHFAVNATSRPTSRLALAAKYKFYQTVNNTPRTLFQPITNDDLVTGQLPVTSDESLFTQPYDYVQNKVDLNASYRVFKATTLKFGYGLEIMNRDHREVDDTVENTFQVRASSNYFKRVAAGVHLSIAEKRGDSYSSLTVYNSRHTPQFIAGEPVAERFDSAPDLRRFDIADRQRFTAGGNVSVFLFDSTTVGVNFNFMEDDYDNSELGLTHSRNHNVTVDVDYSPDEEASYYAYYTLDDLENDQRGRSFVGFGAGFPANAFDPANNWEAAHDDVSHTVGVGTVLRLMDGKLTLNGDYSYSTSTTEIDFSAGTNLAVPQNMPDLETRLHTFKAEGKYKVAKKLDVGLGFELQLYDSDDFATDNVAPASAAVANVLTLSGSVPDYQAYVGMVFATYHFGTDDL